MKPKPIVRISQSDIGQLEERIERLETLAHLNGDMMLFFAETKHCNYLIAAPNFEAVLSYLPENNTIDYVGRASSQYKEWQVIKMWYANNG